MNDINVKDLYLKNLSPNLTYVLSYEYKDIIFDVAIFIKDTGQLCDLIRVKPSFDLDSYLMMLADLNKYRFLTNSLDVTGIYLVNDFPDEMYDFNMSFFEGMMRHGYLIGFLELEIGDDEQDYIG